MPLATAEVKRVHVLANFVGAHSSHNSDVSPRGASLTEHISLAGLPETRSCGSFHRLWPR
jgi:hypothetical protein